MPTKQVTVSGAVGKQVYTSAQPVTLKSLIVDAVSATVVTIRKGYASGDVFVTVSVPAGDSKQFGFGKEPFKDGMHVKVIGTNSKGYLVIE